LKGRHRILVASSNPGKVAEIRTMLGSDVRWVGLADFPKIAEIEEDGATFAENARKKAFGYAKATGLWTIADDSGLVIDALGGKPGIESARFSKAKDKNRKVVDCKNIAKVLELLKCVPKEKRVARFVCCLCLANPEGVLIETEGTLEGFITEEEIGKNGLGYDPIFFVPGFKRTVAQLTTEEKNAISHRGNALRKLKPLLAELLKGA